MKVFLKNVIIKKILIAFVTIIMVSNFIMPNYVRADDEGDVLLNSLTYALAAGSDSVLGVIQEILMGTNNIIETNDVTGAEEYKILYGPAIIFSGSVPAFDVNFVTANDESDSVHYDVVDIDDKDEMAKFIKENGITKDSFVHEATFEYSDDARDYVSDKGSYTNYGIENTSSGFIPSNKLKFRFQKTWLTFSQDSKTIKALFSDEAMTQNSYIYICNNSIYKSEWVSYGLGKTKLEIYKCNISGTNLGVDVELKSTAYALKSHIGNWYITLRTLALVGLLSVLVYLGIRIILNSSSAQDKAKYKNMLKDWVVAICILFTLHYIMAFMLNFTDSLNGILNNTAISQTINGNTTDDLMNLIRGNVGDYANYTDTKRFGYVLMYMVLIFITVKFTIQYLKRVVYMAFLTMIAPMIALTYPIDKVKDGKAQAFSFWLREYIFNCLIQPVHLLLYTALVSSAINIGDGTGNMLYALAALAFLMSAEKFIKQMFGMKSESPIGTMGAAAGGALAMSLINKIRAGSKKSSGSGDESPKGTRTVTRNAGNSNNSNSNSNQANAQGDPLDNNSSVNNNINNNVQNGSMNNNLQQSTLSNNNNVQQGNTNVQQGNNNIQQGNNNIQQNSQANNVQQGSQSNTNAQFASNQSGYSVGRGLATIAGVNSLASAGATFKKLGKGALKVGAGAAGAGILGSIMLANEIADGHILEDPEKSIAQIGGAAAAGYMGASALTNNTMDTAGSLYDKYKRGAMGDEAYNNEKFDKAVFASSDYRMMAQDPAVKAFAKEQKKSVRALTSEYLENGITNMADVRTMMQSKVTGDQAKTYMDVGIDKAKDIITLNGTVAPDRAKELKSAGFDSASKMKKIQENSKFRGVSGEELKYRKIIAETAKNRGIDTREEFINFARNYGINQDEAEKIHRDIREYLLL